MPDQRLPGAAPVGRRIRIRSRKVPPPEPKPEPIKPVQHAAATIGAVFGLVGLLGFLPGLTMHMDDITVAGEHTTTLLFGVFAVSVLHNVIHLLYAVAGLALATRARTARWFLITGGAGYLLLALLGVTGVAHWIPLNTADGWLHLTVGAAMVGLSLLPARARRT
jgi:hypothetical protein